MKICMGCGRHAAENDPNPQCSCAAIHGRANREFWYVGLVVCVILVTVIAGLW